MLHPLSHGQEDKQNMLSFHPHSSSQQVKIKLVGVPLDEIVDGNARCWWPARIVGLIIYTNAELVFTNKNCYQCWDQFCLTG